MMHATQDFVEVCKCAHTTRENEEYTNEEYHIYEYVNEEYHIYEYVNEEYHIYEYVDEEYHII